MVKNPPANARDTGSIPGREDPLEKGITAHTSICAWRIPWTEKPGGLQSMPQRAGHDRTTNTSLHGLLFCGPKVKTQTRGLQGGLF